MNNLEKEKKQHPFKFLGSMFTAGLILFGAAACNSGGEGEGAVEEEPFADTEEVGYDTSLEETESELVANDAVGEFDEWDTNDDNVLDEEEFGTVAGDAAIYDEWDENNDGVYSEDELYGGIYGVYDEDDDGLYTEDEFNTWNTAWGGEYDFGAWDTNDDNMLDEEEYTAGVGEAGIYDNWDADNDGIYTENEVYGGLYDTWDYNEDGTLAEDEFATVDYGLWGF